MSSHRHSDVVPFFTRRIGLYGGRGVPLRVGGKVSGKSGNTNFGGLVTRTGQVKELVPRTTMGAFRVRQNVGEGSNVGVLATFGDPSGADGSYLVGTDATYQTSRLFGSKNFILGGWGLMSDREGSAGKRTAFGAKIDYPNDILDVALVYIRVGDGFEPAMGFVPRNGITKLSGGGSFRVYPNSIPWLRMANHQLRPSVVWDLEGNWESYTVFTAPINWRLTSGDRVEFNVSPEGEQLMEPFRIADGVVIEPGAYHFTRYRLEWEMAAKRMVSGQLTWWFGDFYDGDLDQLEATIQIRPSELLVFNLTATRNVGEVKAGKIDQQVYGLRVQANFSPDLQLTSFVQYDDESKQLGTNTRLRWTFHPLGDLFLVYNYNVMDQLDNPRSLRGGMNRPNRWALESTQIMLKVQYALRY